jgi:hypothetical protein
MDMDDVDGIMQVINARLGVISHREETRQLG